MREAMEEGQWELNAPLEGRAIGRGTASRASGLNPGDLVFHRHVWRTHALSAPRRLACCRAPTGCRCGPGSACSAAPA
jgi:NADPH-dependent curcumin reductase CurA